jgi:hypothetical protein
MGFDTDAWLGTKAPPMRCARAIAVTVLTLMTVPVPALDASWHTTHGGGRSTGGSFTVTGVIGQTAGKSSGGSYEVTGGFVSVFLGDGTPEPPEFHPADINRDGVVNAVDVQLVINAALSLPIDPSYNADINNDGLVNAVDVQQVINAALGLS